MTGAHDRNVHKNIARRWFEAASGPGVRYTSAWRFGDTGVRWWSCRRTRQRRTKHRVDSCGNRHTRANTARCVRQA